MQDQQNTTPNELAELKAMIKGLCEIVTSQQAEIAKVSNDLKRVLDLDIEIEKILNPKPSKYITAKEYNKAIAKNSIRKHYS